MGGKIYSCFSYNFAVSSVFVLLMTLFLTDAVGYLPVFLLCAGASIVSLLMMLKFDEKSPWKGEEANEVKLQESLTSFNTSE